MLGRVLCRLLASRLHQLHMRTSRVPISTMKGIRFCALIDFFGAVRRWSASAHLMPDFQGKIRGPSLTRISCTFFS